MTENNQVPKQTSRLARLLWIVVVGALAIGAYTMRPAAREDTLTVTENDTPIAIPRLVDLGADKCVPCKLMAPILEELKTEYAGRLNVEFIDVWKNPSASAPYGVSIIPTQIFFAADGTELFRHEGFYSKEDILAKCAELGFEL
jgi:thioredoxin 1